MAHPVGISGQTTIGYSARASAHEAVNVGISGQTTIGYSRCQFGVTVARVGISGQTTIGYSKVSEFGEHKALGFPDRQL